MKVLYFHFFSNFRSIWNKNIIYGWPLVTLLSFGPLNKSSYTYYLWTHDIEQKVANQNLPKDTRPSFNGFHVLEDLYMINFYDIRALRKIHAILD